MGAFLYHRALKLQRRNNTCLCVRINVQTRGGTGHFAGVRLVGPLLQLQRDTQDSAQSPSPSLHTRGASQQATGDLEPAQENREKTRILSRRNYRIKSLQAGWSKTGVGACRSHLIIICALLYLWFLRDDRVSVPRNANLWCNNTSRYSRFVYRVILQEEIAA